MDMQVQFHDEKNSLFILIMRNDLNDEQCF